MQLDLNAPLPAISPEFEPLRHDFNSSVDQLAYTVLSVSGGVATIGYRTREISLGSNDLSDRTERRAATLEETAAALSAVTVKFAQPSKIADEARAVADQANRSADDRRNNAQNRILPKKRLALQTALRAYDALTTARSYKRAWSPRDAAGFMLEQKGQLDPSLLKANNGFISSSVNGSRRMKQIVANTNPCLFAGNAVLL